MSYFFPTHYDFQSILLQNYLTISLKIPHLYLHLFLYSHSPSLVPTVCYPSGHFPSVLDGSSSCSLLLPLKACYLSCLWHSQCFRSQAFTVVSALFPFHSSYPWVKSSSSFHFAPLQASSPKNLEFPFKFPFCELQPSLNFLLWFSPPKPWLPPPPWAVVTVALLASLKVLFDFSYTPLLTLNCLCFCFQATKLCLWKS